MVGDVCVCVCVCVCVHSYVKLYFKFEEYQRRDKQNKIKKVLSVHSYLTEEEALKGIEKSNNDEVC